MFSSKRSKFAAAGIAAIVIGGGSYGIVAATTGSGTATTTASNYPFAHDGTGSGSGSNARTGPEPGGSTGTVTSVSSSGFTFTTSGGQKVTVNETSTTSYKRGTSPASANAVTTGESVLVLGMVDSTTITATEVIAQPPSTDATSPGGQVIPYTQGKQGSSQQVGTIPSDYSQGTGTIVSGTTADKATEAALAVYPGGVVDRVVALGNGDYEVHYIGVNWPHHIFVNQDFQVIGANS